MTFICGIRLPVATIVIYDGRVWFQRGIIPGRGEVDKRDRFYHFDLFCSFDYDGEECYERVKSYLSEFNKYIALDSKYNRTTMLLVNPLYKKLDRVIKDSCKKGSFWGLLLSNTVFLKTRSVNFARLIEIPKPNFWRRISLLLSIFVGIELYISYKHKEIKFKLVLYVLLVSFVILLAIANYLIKRGLCDREKFMKNVKKLCVAICGFVIGKAVKFGEERNIIDYPFRVYISYYYKGKNGLCWEDNIDDLVLIEKFPGKDGIRVKEPFFKFYFYDGKWVHDSYPK